MTVAAKSPSKSYTEDGSTLTYAVPFRYLDPTHLLVKRTVAGVTTTLTHGLHYTASAAPTDAGGILTLITTIAGGQLRIRRATPRSQQHDYVTYDNFPAESHEAGMDRDMMVNQEQDVAAIDAEARMLRVPDGETVGVLPDAAGRAGKVQGYDLSGQPVMVYPAVPASAAQPERLVLTLEQFGGGAQWTNPGSRGVDNAAALAQALDVVNRYAPVNTRWPRVPRIELGMGAYFFSGGLDLKVACHLRGQASGLDDFNGGTRIMVPGGTRGITINESNTRGGGTEGATTSARGTVLEGLQIEAEASSGGTAWDYSTANGNPGANTCGLWLRAAAEVRNCSVKGFAGNAIQIVAFSGGGGDLEGNASKWKLDSVMVRDCLGYGLYVNGNDANTGVANGLQVRLTGLGGIFDRDTLGNGYNNCEVDGYATITAALILRAACNHGGINYLLINATPGIGAATTPGTDPLVWYPLYAAAASDFFLAWSAVATYVAMPPVLVTGGSNRSTFLQTYIEGGLPGSSGGTPAFYLGGQSNWTNTSSGFTKSTTQWPALYSSTGAGGLLATQPGTTERTQFGEYTEGSVGAGLPGTIWKGRTHKLGETDYAMRFHGTSGDIVLDKSYVGTPLLWISTPLSDRKLGGPANVPDVVGFPNFAMVDPADSGNDRIMCGGLAVPTTGYHAKGKRIWNANPGPGKPDYWECLTGGTPGTWVGCCVQPFQSGAATAVHTGGVAETTLATLPIPAGVLGPNGSIEIDVTWTVPNNANSKTLRARYGGIGGFAFWSQAVTAAVSARGLGRLQNRNVANAQLAYSGASFGSTTSAALTGAIDSGVAQDLVITGQLANGTDSIVIESYTVKIVPGV